MGKLVTLSGIDGVGKSTQVMLLTDYLQSHGQSVNAGESMFSYHLFRPIIQIIKSITDQPLHGALKVNHSLLSKLWFIPAFVDIWFSYLFLVRPQLSRFDYIIADRFYTDMWANMLYYGYLPKWGFSLIRLLPRANLSLLLLADPATILTREQEFPPHYYHAQHEIYSRLGRLVPYRVIDANGTPSHTHDQILTALKS